MVCVSAPCYAARLSVTLAPFLKTTPAGGYWTVRGLVHASSPLLLSLRGKAKHAVRDIFFFWDYGTFYNTFTIRARSFCLWLFC